MRGWAVEVQTLNLVHTSTRYNL
eukprot:COSAG02_NODE_8512_length_2542_cov_2.005321_3_plen_22_part_01